MKRQKYIAEERTSKYAHWSFDPINIPEPIAQKLVYNQEFFGDEPTYETMLAMVMNTLLEELPEQQEEAVRLLYITGLSQHKAAAIIGCSHKTVAARARKGLDAIRQRLTDSVWIAELLGDRIPSDRTVPNVDGGDVANVLKSLLDRRVRESGK